ncbi:MAG: cyclic nucleotide-binding domain-containing protein [Rhodospirillales bacterium]
MSGQLVRALRRYFRRPRIVLELALLAALLSSAIIILLAVGSAQVLIGEGSEALPMVYLLLAAVSVPLASGISAALCRWSVARISRAVSSASLFLVLALRLALAADVPGTALAICIAAYALEIVFDTLFWLSASEQLPTLDLKRHTPFLAAAFGLGGIFAGFVATAFCEMFAGEDLLVLNAGFFALCALQYRRIDRIRAAAPAQMDDEPEPGLIEALKATVGIVRAFPIIGAMSVGVLLMSGLFCLQDYLAMSVYEGAFPEADALSSFMAVVFAGHQAAELLILAVCGRLILERAGPVLRNLLFPLSTCIGLVALLSFNNLAAAVLVHANVIALSNAVFEPVKTLNYAALPYRVLGQVRMMIDGVLYPLGIALSAAGLLWLQTRSGVGEILLVSIAVAVVFVGASATTGAMFLPNLLRSLRLRAITPSEYARADKGRAFSAGDIRQLLAHPDAEARRFGADLAKSLAPELLTAELIEPGKANGENSDPPPWPHPRRTAESGAPSGEIRLREDDFAAAGEIPPLFHGSGGDERRARNRRSDAGIWRLAFVVRRPSSKRIDDIGLGLEDRASAVRRTAASLLARFGAVAVPTAAARLASPRQEVVEAAIHALGGIGTRKAEHLLRDHVRPLYGRVQQNLAALQALLVLPRVDEDAHRALEAWLLDSNRRIMRRVMVVKSALGNPRDVKLLHALTMAREERTRSDAVEALVNLPTKRFIQPLVPLLEGHTHTTDSETTSAPEQVIKDTTADDPFARLLAARVIAASEGRAFGPLGDQTMLNLVLFLKTTPLFGAIPLEDIARIAGLAEPVFLGAGETITEADEMVRHVSVVRTGTVELRIEGRSIETIGPGSCIGESAVFGEERHPAGLRAASAVSLLRFPLSLVADLVAEYPEALAPLALDLLRRMTRLRTRLAAARELPEEMPTEMAPADPAAIEGAPSSRTDPVLR